MTPLGQSDANGSIMPARAWVAIQMSDLIPISRLQTPILACKRYHCVQKRPIVKVDSQQASYSAAPVPAFHKLTRL
jgi:hypothetical protein